MAVDSRPVWTLKGISPETREAVKVAARRSGKTMSAWVEDTLRRAATETIKAPPLPGPTQDQLMARLLELVEAQNTRLAALEERRQEPQEEPRRSWLARLFGR
jgi:localization factor PodJL